MTIGGMPLVTVYITNYNYERFVAQAIESVLAQTFTDYEIIIIDDGSTDGSREIISKYEGHERVRVIFQENKGLNRTNNIALKAARGTYIIRLDADDYLDDNALLVMTNMLEAEPDLGLIFPDYYYVDADGNITGQERRHDFADHVSLLDQPAHGACTLIRKAALIGVGGYNENFSCQDGYDLWLRFIEKHKIRNVNLPLFYYRHHGRNLTDNKRHILETRAKIKEAHVVRMKKSAINTLAILPIRGPGIDPGSQVLEDLGGKKVLDWTIEAALESNNIKMLIVSSSDMEVLAHVRQRYGAEVLIHERSLDMSRENVHLYDTMEQALSCCKLDFCPDAYFLLFAEYPLRSAMFLDKAVNTMRIFDVDSVIAVVPESDVYFRHDGSGLQSIGNGGQMSSLRVEREYLYRMTGGMQLVKASFYRQTGKHYGGTVGHVVLDELATIRLSDPFGLELIRMILEKYPEKLRLTAGII